MFYTIILILQILDWVLYSSHIGKFGKLRDMGNSLCKAAERAMNRDGDVCNKAYIGVNITPNIRQQNQVNDDIFEMTSHVKMDRIYENYEDVTYQKNDIVYCETIERYGKVNGLYIINNGKWLDLLTWEKHSTDYETGIDYCEMNGISDSRLVEIDNLTPPLVTGIDGNNIWFISKVILNLPWLSEHLRE